MNSDKIKETIWLTAFFKFNESGCEYGFERINLQYISKTESDARNMISFCDEAGWYEGVLIEERTFDYEDMFFRGKRIWMIQDGNGDLNEIEEPTSFKNVIHLIG